ncbi:MAG: hypothetical protein JXR70_11435 [Spirochaetales bacterium]|nr:hypothetical protein [Spirochaetales bacterium]
MKRKYLIFFMIMIMTGLFAQDLDSLLAKYKANQKQIQTFIGSGSSTVKMYHTDGTLIREMTSIMSLYLKHPDLLKLTTDKPVKSVIIQQGEYITQKIDGQGGAVTTRVDETNNVIKYYFGEWVADYADTSMLVASDTAVINGKTLYRYQMDPGIEANAKTGINITRVDIYFNENGMPEKTVMFNDDKPMIISETSYTNKNGIYVPRKIISDTNTNGIQLKSEIIYNVISVNTEILDKEFDIR